MSSTRIRLLTTALAAAALTTAVAPAPATAAASTLNLTPGIRAFVPFPDAGGYWFEYDAFANASRRVQVFDPVIKKWLPDFVAASANGVVVRTVLPPELSVFNVQPKSGFACTRASNVVTCTGNIPSTGTVKAVTISAVPPVLSTQYWVSSTIDPGNVIAESSETDNTAWCGASAFSGRC